MNARPALPLIVAVLGVALMAWSFSTGVGAALNGGGSGALVYTIIFIAALVAVLAAVVLAVITLARTSARVLPILTIVVALVPLVGVIVLAVNANS